MKKIRKISFITLALTFSLNMSANAAGLLKPVHDGYKDLQIKEHRVNVIIEDGYAVTTVDQVFYNPNDVDLEAIYSFPVPKSGAVSEFTMWIDGKPIHGEVLENKRAREVYESQKSAGKNAGITTKNSYKTFDIAVTPVKKSQNTKIRLSYIQAAHIDSGIGNYLYPLEEGGVDEERLSFWTANEKVQGLFSFDLKLRSSYPVEALRLPNNPQAIINKKNNKEWAVHFDNISQNVPTNHNGEKGENESTQNYNSYNLDSDIAVYFRHQENLPGSVDLITYKENGNDRGSFMMTITPGDDLQPITAGSDFIFVLDISGSMSGKYAVLAEGVSKAMGKMSNQDRFKIILFNDSASELTNGYISATPENVSQYSQKVANLQPHQGTNLYAGLFKAINSLDADRISSIFLVTDGVANVGETKQKSFINLVKKKDVRLFTFVMGNSANKPLLSSMTNASGGFAVSVSNSDDIIGKIMLAKRKITHQALHGAKIKIEGIKTANITPDNIGSVYKGQQLIIFGHYFGEGEAKVTFSGKISGQEKTYQTKFNFPKSSQRNPEIERLWAYSKIEELTNEMNNFGEDSDIKEAITDIALEYSLVSNYTSMVVVEEEVFKQLGIDRKNNKRLKKELSASQKRQDSKVHNARVDSHQAMFKTNRATLGSSSGGGSFDIFMILILIPMLVLNQRRRIK
ncbi:MAG: Ca-activated chloride channel family protein [Lentimonas sp.]|jgi:Ca-activated chloride channel family protein